MSLICFLYDTLLNIPCTIIPFESIIVHQQELFFKLLLIEAGKLALNLTQHGEEATTQIDGADLVQETVVDSAIETVVGDSAQVSLAKMSDKGCVKAHAHLR